MPVKDPFDYFIPSSLIGSAKIGARVMVPFRERKLLGYITAISPTTKIKKLKPILGIIDKAQLLNQELLKLTRQVSDYYFCSWGEAIEAGLPLQLRKARQIEGLNGAATVHKAKSARRVLIQDLSQSGRWEIYFNEIEKALAASKNIIFLTPQIDLIEALRDKINKRFKTDLEVLHSRQSPRVHLDAWLRIRNAQVRIVLGTRQAIFAPLVNLGLIILDQENSNLYKQDQSPHYNAREVAFMRSKISGADLLLCDVNPSLESLYLARKNKIEYRNIKAKDLPEIRIIDMKKEVYSKVRRTLLSYPIQEMISRALESKAKILIFLNRKGFSTCAYCPVCRKTLTCPRCNVNLTYFYRENKLHCRYCNYNSVPYEICPDCKSGYIRYSGSGIEKVESELARFFPQAKISKLEGLEGLNQDPAQILIATSLIFKIRPQDLEFIGVLTLDNALNRVDFRAAEKAFSLLLNLLTLGSKNIIIQSNLSNHYCFQAVLKSDLDLFYKAEFTFRKELGLPPFSHLAFIKLRGENPDKVKQRAQGLFDRLKKNKSDSQVELISCFAGAPQKLRGKYYWQVLLKSKTVKAMTNFLRNNLKISSHSDIIVTVDIDPI